MTGFGPQLIGETEKSLNAILLRVLRDVSLSERQWVTLRIAAQHDGGRPLTAAVADRALFPDADALVADLRARGLLDGDDVTPAGADLLARLGSRIAELTAPVWRDLPAADIAATERVLNLVVDRARSVLGVPPAARAS
jgi:hypothetical protein